MADFDAGSIEGRLELDSDPFIRGLREAKARAAEFERTTSANASAGVDVNEGDSGAKITALEARLKRLDHERVHPTIEVETSRASAAIRSLDAAVNRLAGAYVRGSGGGLGAPSGHGMMMLVGLAASLAPALGPATGAIGLFGAAGIAAFGGMAVSMGLWGTVAKGVFGQIEKADKAGKTLTGSLGQLQGALKGLSGEWTKLQDKAAPGIAKALVPTFQTLDRLLPKLLPLINSISKGVGGALRPIDNLLKSGMFERFIHLLSANAVKDLPQVGHALANILGGLMGVFRALNPIIQAGLPVIVRMTKEFEKWANSGAGSFVQSVFDRIQKYGPETIQLLHNLFGVLGAIGRGLAPLTGPALDFLVALTGALKGINLAPLASGIGQVLETLKPFLTVIETLVNILLPPLGKLLGTLADSFIGPLGKSLAQELTPALQAVAGVLNTLAPYLGQFIASIADLVNPTGVGLLSSLIVGLAPIVKAAIPPVAALVIALEGMVDTFLKVVGPAVIPAVVGALAALVKVLTPVIGALAWFLSHKSVALAILGIATAVKAVTTAMKIWAAVTKGIEFIAGVFEAISLGWAGVTVAQDANTASMVANRLAMIAWAGIQLVVRGATLLWTGAQWLLNAALDANPIALIVIAVAALVVGVIEAYKHVGWFRDAVNACWEALKVAGKWIEGAGVAVWHALGTAFQFVRHHLQLFMLLLGPVGVAIDVVITIVKHWSKIVDIAKSAWQHVISWLRGVPHMVTSIFKDAGSWLLNAGKDIIRGLWNGEKAIWSTEIGWIKGLGGKILDGLGDLGSTLYNSGWALIAGFWNGIKDRFASLLKDAAGLMGHLAGLFHHSPPKWGPFSGTGDTPYSGRALMEGFAKGIRAGAPNAEQATHDTMAAISRTLKAGVGSVVGQASLSVSMTRSADPAALYAASQKEATDALVVALEKLANGMGSKSKEEQDAMTDSLTKAFTAAGTAQTQKIITAVKKR